MSHTPSPRSKARSTRAKVAIKCDVTVPLTFWLTVWLAKLRVQKQRGSNDKSSAAQTTKAARLKRNVPPLRAAPNNIVFPPAPLSTHDNCAPRTRFVPSSSTRVQEYVDASSASLAPDSGHIVAF